MSAVAVTWVAACFFVGAFVQAVSGFGFALIAVPLLTLALSPRDAVVAQTIAGSVLSFAMAWQLRAHVDRPAVVRTLPAMFAGMPVGLVVGDLVGDRALRVAVGLAVLAATVTIAKGVKARHASSALDRMAGLTSGVLSTSTGTNGPPLVVALSAREVDPNAFRATLTALFALANVVALPLFALNGNMTARAAAVALIGAVPMVAGRLAGEGVFRRLPVARFRHLVLLMLTAAGVVALVNGLR
ncbi:MAG: sulfite exporter TauE/SafE family protein [Acidimicrobiia bacterium]